MQTTTFKQAIGNEILELTVPMHRVETIVNRIDRLIEQNKLKHAKNAAMPFIGAEKKTSAPKPAKKVSPIDTIIYENRNQGRHYVIEKLMETGMSKASAYYRVRKAGL